MKKFEASVKKKYFNKQYSNRIKPIVFLFNLLNKIAQHIKLGKKSIMLNTIRKIYFH